MTPRTVACLVLALFTVACAHAGGKPALTFNVEIPKGWKTVDTDEPMVFMTRDGGYKQYIVIRERSVSEPFKFTQKALRKDMLPEEAAQVIVNEVISDSNVRNFSLLENVPAKVVGRNGFRLTFLYTDADGYVFKTMYYGFLHGDLFYNIRYAATQEEYFQKDLRTFQKVFDSFALAAAK